MQRRSEAGAKEGALPGSAPDDVGDVGDASQRDEATDLSARLSEGDWNALRAIDDALERIRSGEYGICQRCGEAIDPARLEAIPEAALCVSCAERGVRDKAEAPPRSPL